MSFLLVKLNHFKNKNETTNMLKTGIATFKELMVPIAPSIRRSSHNKELDSNFQEIENVKTFYKTRTSHIENIVKLTNMYKNLKKISNIVTKMLIMKYGTNHGTLLSNLIMEDYLAVTQDSVIWPTVWYNINNFYEYHDPSTFKQLQKMRIYDPRVRKYKVIELTPYLANGYDIICDGTTWYILANDQLCHDNDED